MKIAIYSPYLPDHFGGGERYLFDVAQILSSKHQVFIAIGGLAKLNKTQIKKIRSNYEKFLDVNLDKINFITTPIGTNTNFLKKLFWTKKFDRIYYQTDGSLFFSLAGKNILHIQIPFTQKKTSLIERLKLANWQIKNTNSFFTKSIVEKAWQTKINYVHQPKISLSSVFNSTVSTANSNILEKKEKIILSVGRFFTHLHSKRQDMMVDSFIKFCQNYPGIAKGWQLVLIGSIENQNYAKQVAKQAKGFPIKILNQVSREKLENYYKKAAIYWHAAGFEIDEKQNPEKVEHFGITTGEAMLAGCLPIVINKGGQKEILGLDLADLLWETQEELIEKTVFFINNKSKRISLAKKAKVKAQKFNKEKFADILWQMIEN